MKKYAIIVAGGSGSRMNSSIPKQFMELGNKPILMHSIEAFYKYDNSIYILIVLPKNQFEYWSDLTKKYNKNK